MEKLYWGVVKVGMPLTLITLFDEGDSIFHYNMPIIPCFKKLVSESYTADVANASSLINFSSTKAISFSPKHLSMGATFPIM